MPWGLIGMLGLVVAVERFVASRELALTANPMYLDWRESGRASRGDATRAELLALGDSLVQLGVQPLLLEARLGRPAYNLAVAGAPAPASYFLLRRVLAAGGRPRALLVDFHLNNLVTPPRLTEAYWPHLLSLAETVDVAWTTRSVQFLAASLPAHVLPSLRHRIEARASILRALRGQPDPVRELLLAHLRNRQVNHGATVEAARAGPSPAANAPRPDAPKARWAPYPGNVRYVRRFLDLAARSRLPVFWLLPPLSPDRQRTFEALGHDGAHERFVRGLQAEYPNVVVLDGRHASYGRDVFIDSAHLDGRGAAVFTEALAGLIGPRLGGGTQGERWVALPPFRVTPGDVLLEDVEQSRLALGRGPAAILR